MHLSNSNLQSLRRLQQKKYRDQSRSFLIEGLRLCEEALASSAEVQQVVISTAVASPRLQRLIEQIESRDIPIYEVPASILKKLANTEAPQGIVAQVAKPAGEQGEWANLDEPLIVAIDQLQDPGNLGTLLRTADWFGVKTVLLSRHTVDLYNPKVVRSTMGSIFRLRCFDELDLYVALTALREKAYSVMAAVVENGSPLTRQKRKNVLLIGNEAEGLAPPLLHLADQHFTIPRLGAGESLNAAIAAGIALYLLTKR